MKPSLMVQFIRFHCKDSIVILLLGPDGRIICGPYIIPYN